MCHRKSSESCGPQGGWAHRGQFTCNLRPGPGLRVKNPCLADTVLVAKTPIFLLFLTAETEGIFLHVTVPRKVRSNQSVDSEKQVKDQEYLIIKNFKTVFVHLCVKSDGTDLYSRAKHTVFTVLLSQGIWIQPAHTLLAPVSPFPLRLF